SCANEGAARIWASACSSIECASVRYFTSCSSSVFAAISAPIQGVSSRLPCARIPERVRSEMSDYEQPLVREGALRQPVATDARAVFGQVMGLVAVTVGFFALGAYIGRNLTGGAGIAFFVVGFACAFGAGYAARRSERLGIALLFGLGLFLGMAVGPMLAYYAKTNPAILWQSGGATGLFVGALGSYG